MKKAKQLFSHSLGFEKLSKYERAHRHEANMLVFGSPNRVDSRQIRFCL